MATIKQRTGANGRKSFRARVRLQGYPEQNATFRTLTEAKRWAKITESAILEGRHFSSQQSKKHTLAQAIDRYLDDVLPELSTSEQKNRDRHLKYWKREIGAMRLAQLCNDAEPIRECRKALLRSKSKRGRIRSPATVNRYLASLSKLFTCCMRWGWASSNPLRLVDKSEEPPGRDRFLSEAELARLLEAAAASEDPYLDTVVKLGLTTGARYSEILWLQWSDVSLERETVTFRDRAERRIKNRQSRTVPLVEPALAGVKALAENRRADSELLFPWSKPDQPKDIRGRWDAALTAAKIKDFRFHDLRHTAASYLAMNGARPSELAAVLGHKTLAMVKRYSHVSEQHTAELVRSMAAKRFGNG